MSKYQFSSTTLYYIFLTAGKHTHYYVYMVPAQKLPDSAYAGIAIGEKEINISILQEEEVTNYKTDRYSDLAYFLEGIAEKKRVKIVAAALGGGGDLKKIGSKLWLKQDVVPLFINNNLVKNTKELARIAADSFVDGQAKVNLGKDNKVDVSFLVTLDEYKRITKSADFELLLKLSKKFKGKKIIFFSATPRGGGVALMRHALIRLLNLLGVDATWHVLIERKEIFEITKLKFHNVLQGISGKKVRLTEKDKAVYNYWISENFELLKDLFKEADVIVIDDPQPSGLVEIIKERLPSKKVIYRSHIHLQSDIIKDENSPQHATWKFIWRNIRKCDLFISHPIESFVPAGVPREKVLFMTASTDPLDGLNKPLAEREVSYYLKLFNKLLLEDGQTPLDPDRQYIAQVARFDPSKGILDVLETYAKIRNKNKGNYTPALVIAGNSSIDDPDGEPVYNLTRKLIQKKYKNYSKDIKTALVPHIDQILNTIMRKASVYLQLSSREGFEDKISGALMKSIPTIVYDVGGMPLQIKDGVSGYIVKEGGTDRVSELVSKLLVDEKLHKRMSRSAKENVIPEANTVSNAINWLYIANELLEKGRIEGNLQKVYNMARDVSNT